MQRSSEVNFLQVDNNLTVNGTSVANHGLSVVGAVDILGSLAVSGNLGFFGETPSAQISGLSLAFPAISGPQITGIYESTAFGDGTVTGSYTIGQIVYALKTYGLLV